MAVTLGHLDFGAPQVPDRVKLKVDFVRLKDF